MLVYRSVMTVMTMTLVTLACRVHPPQILQSGVMPVCPLNKTWQTWNLRPGRPEIWGKQTEVLGIYMSARQNLRHWTVTPGHWYLIHLIRSWNSQERMGGCSVDFHPQQTTSWWSNQPIWKICSSNWIISPNFGVKKKQTFETTT